MVDCGNLRCAQERRTFRKELLTWSKKIPVAVGLEQIAKEFGGREKIHKLLEPFNCLETNEVKDWDPEENCFYCEDRVKLLVDTVNQLKEEFKNEKISVDHPNIKYLQEILPFCPQYYTQGRENFLEELGLDKNGRPTTPAELPCEVDPPTPTKPPTELKVPQVSPQTNKFKKDVTMHSNGKKYSDDELAAAVSDIRTGKLGTRRASVIYGIPRSTLRNKIFKMECDDNNSTGVADDDQSLTEETPTVEEAAAPLSSLDSSMKLSDLMHHNFFIPPLPFLLPFQPKFEESKDKENEEWEKKLEQMRRKHNINGQWNCEKLAEYANQLNLPFLENIIRKMAQQRFEMERNAIRVKAAELKEPIKSEQTKSSDSDPNEVTEKIVIPSYKSDNAAHEKENSSHSSAFSPIGENSDKSYQFNRIGETLKDIIVKTISEKVKVKTQNDNTGSESLSSALLKNSGGKDDLKIGSAFSVPSASPSKKIKKEDSEKTTHTNSSTSPPKKTRPKRGQYRKYNSQLLIEAVKAVQRGEMSVHRAGSYFGVPHSTLEYKVKERHLLRQKKIKEQQALKLQQEKTPTSKPNMSPLNTPSTSKSDSGSDSGASSDGAFSPQKNLWIPPSFVNGSQIDATSLLGLYSSGFALNTPASELLRKLQHKVQTKTSAFTEDSSKSTSDQKILTSLSGKHSGKAFQKMMSDCCVIDV